LIVTGEDGTIYQVAGKNANGQTVLIAQGAEGEQPVVLLANDGEDNEGIQFQASDAVQLSAAQTVAGAEMETEGDEATAGEGVPENQQLTIQTEGEEGQITAEIVQAELPSPGKNFCRELIQMKKVFKFISSFQVELVELFCCCPMAVS
jgi:hypothetical protein